MILIAISGGVDSMLLAHKYRHNKNVVLAFVNYNFRSDTHIDQKIVEDFARENNLTLEKLILQKGQAKNNFENWARNIRYDFFKQIYLKYNCSKLLVAHHKDDFLETCLMQKKRNPNKLFFGIKQKLKLNGMNVYRPFLYKYWKEEIYQNAKILNLKYHDDYTNNDNSYERNKVRNITLKKLTQEEKEKLFINFKDINDQNKTKIKLINEDYKKWRISKFDVKYLLNSSFPHDLIIIFINKRLKNTNLSKNIIEQIFLFLKQKNNGNKKFLLSNQKYLFKKNNKVQILK